MNRTSIEWTDFTANPLKFRDVSGQTVWGCVHASPGCQHCYAESLAKRFGRGGPFNVPTMNGLTPYLDDAELRRMLTYKPASGQRCFVGDMTDLFGEWVPDELLDRIFAVCARRGDVTWQVLTKRASRMRAYILRKDMPRDIANNLWLGVSCEDQHRYDQRIGHLLRTPAAVRFLSLEPLIGPIDMRMGGMSIPDYAPHDPLPDLNWVIVGGESGPGARPLWTPWVRSLVRQCRAARVPVFVKQLGADVRDRNDAGFLGERPQDWPDHIDQDDRIEHDLDGTRDGYQGAPVRIHLKNRKGGDPSEWPKDLRVRQFPIVPTDRTT